MFILIEGYMDMAVLERIGDPAGMLEEMQDFLKVAGGSVGSTKDVLKEKLDRICRTSCSFPRSWIMEI